MTPSPEARLLGIHRGAMQAEDGGRGRRKLLRHHQIGRDAVVRLGEEAQLSDAQPLDALFAMPLQVTILRGRHHALTQQLRKRGMDRGPAARPRLRVGLLPLILQQVCQHALHHAAPFHLLSGQASAPGGRSPASW